MTSMTGGAAVVESLKAQNVDHVFGLIGSAGMEIFDALYDSDAIRFIGVRDERTGVHMADGYARASGQAGVFLAGQNGPGATNLVTGLGQAYAAFSPVVALAGSLSSAHIYRDAFQEVDQQALFKPITKKTLTLTHTNRIPEMMREAFRTALSPRRGPVLLNLPRDLLAETADFAEGFDNKGRSFTGGFTGDIEQIGNAAKLLMNAAQPLILVGGGVKNTRCHAVVERLAERLNVPIVMSPGHGDAIPAGHSLYAGQVGPRGNSVASDLMKRADVILALGTRIGFNTTFYTYDNLNKDAAIIQVDEDPGAIGRFFPVEIGIMGSAANVASELEKLLAHHKPELSVNAWTDAFKQARSDFISERKKSSSEATTPIKPAFLFNVMREIMPEDAMYTMDAGTLCLQATDALNYGMTPSLFTPLDFGLVGFSYACGLGIKLACPERPVISLMGDGGFGMTTSEIGTAVQYGINTVCVVMNNGCWGAEKAYQRDFFGERYIGADVPNPAYDKLAELWGAKGYRVEKAEDLAAVLKEAIACGRPAIVDVKMDPNALYSFRRDSFKHRAAKS
ncbi:sulfoacetaldehyde acetyltransferase [Pollutimonas subterranea]|uniref:Sulfoacetaldehyde acetyltransferase n=1 Tax=Pollutimonas subterranea TaxID=2045210 RepID=A0A2N4U4C9_9BURK|nr:thiamine pyrophosphate-binding protein [Pollutimonas subterranea]PLC49859.1 sulfoacetaldehyde acetyltransferase [Pollutimonas subterranea]